MSTPLPPPPGPAGKTSTQEIPVVPGAVANTQHLPPPPASPGAERHRPTGPVDFVPEPPGARAVSGKAGRRSRGGRAALLPPALAVLAVVSLELGLSLRFGTRALWSSVVLWSAFATVAAALGLLAVAARAMRPGATAVGAAWPVAAAALIGLAVFWLLVGLPVADTDRGFLLTAALGCLGAAVWLGPGRTRASD